MQPIKTMYKDTTFRSRLEARWAVFFDHMDLKWEYEPYALNLPKLGQYTPDFVIETQYIAEVKPVWPVGLEIEKARLACDYAIGTILLIGQPEYRCYWMLTLENSKRDERPILLEPRREKIENLFKPAADYETCSSGLPPSHFSLRYRSAVEAARRSRFDGFDKDRETIRRRYE